MKFRLIVLILTHDSVSSLGEVLDSVVSLSPRLFVVDSGSQDGTIQLAEEHGCNVAYHPFENYAAQRNWAQGEAVLRFSLQPTDWVLHLDSDESLSPELAESVARAIATNDPGISGYLVQRLTFFLDHPIRHGHMNPNWHLRLFRVEDGYCEDRLYDQHFVTQGKTTMLQGLLFDKQRANIERWTASHNRWSTAEAQEIYTRSEKQPVEARRVLAATLGGDIRMKKRWVKNNLWYRLPPFTRAFIFFFYSYFVRLGFLDGRIGLVYHVLQAFWFRFLVDAKIMELRLGDQKHPV